MTACEKFDMCIDTLVAEGYSAAEINSLASYCIIADEFKLNFDTAQVLWKGYCTETNGLSIVNKIRYRFERIA